MKTNRNLVLTLILIGLSGLFSDILFAQDFSIGKGAQGANLGGSNSGIGVYLTNNNEIKNEIKIDTSGTMRILIGNDTIFTDENCLNEYTKECYNDSIFAGHEILNTGTGVIQGKSVYLHLHKPTPEGFFEYIKKLGAKK